MLNTFMQIILNAQKSMCLSTSSGSARLTVLLVTSLFFMYTMREGRGYLGDQETISIYRKAGCDKCEPERAPDN